MTEQRKPWSAPTMVQITEHEAIRRLAVSCAKAAVAAEAKPDAPPPSYWHYKELRKMIGHEPTDSQWGAFCRELCAAVDLWCNADPGVGSDAPDHPAQHRIMGDVENCNCSVCVELRRAADRSNQVGRERLVFDMASICSQSLGGRWGMLFVATDAGIYTGIAFDGGDDTRPTAGDLSDLSDADLALMSDMLTEMSAAVSGVRAQRQGETDA